MKEGKTERTQEGAPVQQGEVRRTAAWAALAALVFCLGLSFLAFLNGRERLEQTPALLPAPVQVQQPTLVAGSDERAPVPVVDASDEQVLAEFTAWTERYLEAAEESRPALAEEGSRLAARRRAIMARLIPAAPERALEHAVPAFKAKQLPEAVRGQMERWIDAKGDFSVVAALVDPDSGEAPIRRFVDVDGQRYQAHVYGRRLTQTTRSGIPIHGVVLDKQMALSASPLRVLAMGEVPDPKLPVANEDTRCPISKIASREVAVDAGGVIYYLCSGGHILPLEEQLIAQEGGTGSSGGEVIAQSAWTTGEKTVLIINIKFSDTTTNYHSATTLTNMMNGCAAFVQENSYGATTMTSTFTPLLTLPNPESYYITNGDSVLYSHARTEASNAGYNYTNYTLDAVCWKGGPGSYGGQAYVGARGCWLKSATAGVAAHEFGHNFGLWHANYWTATGDSVIGPGSNNEYGDSFDTMGSANAGAYHFNAYEKNRLDWLPTTNVTTITASGTYRITSFDHANLVSGTPYALKIRKDADRDYWLNFRQKFTSNRWLMSGVDLHWDPWASSNAGSQLLDTTPGTSSGKSDSAVVIGRTFSDTSAGVHITPIRKGGTAPESIDVVVNIGTFSGNSAPSLNLSASATAVGTGVAVNFTASASDANGDTLAYFWDFGDTTFGANAATASKSWTTAKEYVVRCTVSDMKGGVASDYVVVTVGAPGTYRIAGRITHGGAPVEGVRVHNGLGTTDANYRTVWTDSDGNFELAGLPAGSFNVSAVKYGYTFTASGFANPVVVGPSATGVNFTGSIPTYSIAGTVTAAGVAVSGVTVSDGTRSVLTASNGTYTIANVPNGTYTLTATKSGLNYNPSGWSNPVTIAGANLTARNFVAPVYSISGEITGVTASVTISDGTRSTTSYQSGSGKNKRWVYTLSNVPQGSYTLTATLTGYTLVPSGWTNPLSVSGNRSGINFAAGGGTTSYAISGEILGVAQAVTVSDGTRSTTSKLTGKGKNQKWTYTLSGVPAGTYTLTASLAGYTFTPANFTNPVTVSANLTSRNFQGSVAGNLANTPPEIISSPWASPARIKVAGSTFLGVAAEDVDEAPDEMIYIWTKVSGPGVVTFSDNCTPEAEQPEATFSRPGTYVLRVTVHDGDDADTDTVKVIVKR